MNIERKEIIKRFIGDQRTSGVVFNEIQAVFLKSRGTKDVYTLAGERIALELLQKAWDGFSTMIQVDADPEDKSYKQIGL